MADARGSGKSREEQSPSRNRARERLGESCERRDIWPGSCILRLETAARLASGGVCGVGSNQWQRAVAAGSEWWTTLVVDGGLARP